MASTTFVSIVMLYLNIYKRTAELGITLTIPEAGHCDSWVDNAYGYIACLGAGPFPLVVNPRFRFPTDFNGLTLLEFIRSGLKNDLCYCYSSLTCKLLWLLWFYTRAK